MNTYTLPTELFDEFVKKVEHLNLSGANISFDVVSRYIYEGENGIFPVVEFMFEGENPILGEYEFMAVKTLDGSHVLINGQNANEIPKEFWDYTTHCDHCHTKRNRRKFIILRKIATGEILQIGKNCVAEYTHSLADDIRKLMKQMEVCESVWNFDMNGYFPSMNNTYYKIKRYLAIAQSVIAEDGYVSTADSFELRKPSTKNECISIYDKCDSNNVEYKERYQQNEQIVKDMIAWWMNKNDDENPFWLNVSGILNDVYVSEKGLGYITFLPNAYAKYIAHKANTYDFSNEFANHNVNDKVEVELVLRSKNRFDTMFGTKVCYQFSDAEGHCYLWKTSPRMALDDLDISAEKKIILCGTVKEFSEYKNVKQTVLTRCKIKSI